jgi:hypothetical protein
MLNYYSVCRENQFSLLIGQEETMTLIIECPEFLKRAAYIIMESTIRNAYGQINEHARRRNTLAFENARVRDLIFLHSLKAFSAKSLSSSGSS